MSNSPNMSANSLNEWHLDKILPSSKISKTLLIWAILLAGLAIAISGLSVWVKLTAFALLGITWSLSKRYAIQVRAISIDKHHCRLRLNDNNTIELTPPFKSTHLHWWIGIQQPDSHTGKWHWLFRDQFSPEEWKQITTLIKWA